jgi:protein import protein ZIM17
MSWQKHLTKWRGIMNRLQSLESASKKNVRVFSSLTFRECIRVSEKGKQQQQQQRFLNMHPSSCACCHLPSHKHHSQLGDHHHLDNPTRYLSSSFSSSNDESDSSIMDDEISTLTSSGKPYAPPISIPGAQKGGKKLAIIFTCTVCDTRAAKQFTENAYLNGVVIVTCPGCQNKHLIADNLGFFEDQEEGGWNIEKAMAKMGQPVKLVNNDNVLEVNVEDVYGQDAIRAAAESSGKIASRDGCTKEQ